MHKYLHNALWTNGIWNMHSNLKIVILDNTEVYMVDKTLEF